MQEVESASKESIKVLPETRSLKAEEVKAKA
jgi:hypothetical protein